MTVCLEVGGWTGRVRVIYEVGVVGVRLGVVRMGVRAMVGRRWWEVTRVGRFWRWGRTKRVVEVGRPEWRFWGVRLFYRAFHELLEGFWCSVGFSVV